MLKSFSAGILLSCACFGLFCFARATAQQSTDSRSTARSCPNWSVNFDSVNDKEIAETLRSHREQGWDAIIQEGEKLGIGLSEQIEDGERQLKTSRSAEERARNGISLSHRSSNGEPMPEDCSDPRARETNLKCQVDVRHNEVLALEGILDLLRCRVPSHPVLPVRHEGTPIATISVTVTPDDERRSRPTGEEVDTCPCDEQAAYAHAIIVGMEQNEKKIHVKQGSYIVLRFKPEVAALGFSLEPKGGPLQTKPGLIHFPIGVIGAVKAMSPGESKIVVYAGSNISPPSSKARAAGEANSIKYGPRHNPNWAGYSKVGGPFQSIKGSWNVPFVDSVDGYSAAWIGIDGDGSPTVLQTGTDQDVSQGFFGIGVSDDYFAWWELFPAGPVTINLPVNPGDVMSASITPSTTAAIPNLPSLMVITISDTTAGWTWATPLPYIGALSSAEWIVEDPGWCASDSCEVVPFTTFTNVTFDVGDSMMPGSSNLGGAAAAAGNPGFTNDDELIITQNGVDLARPSPADCDADGFTVASGSLPPASPGPFFSTLTLPSGSAGGPYSATLSVRGLSSPSAHMFTANPSQLPPGLALNASTGVISGVPTQVGAFQFTAMVTDTGTTATCENQISVQINRLIRVPHCLYDPSTKKWQCF